MNSNNIAIMLDNTHKHHYRALLNCCMTGEPHLLFPELDFKDPVICAFVGSYISNKMKS